MSYMKRIFLGIDFDVETKNALGQCIAGLKTEAERRGLKIRWATTENLHLTLKFLGEVEDSQIERITKACREVICSQVRFDLSIGNLGAFPNMRSARIVWVGVHDDKGPLRLLASVIEKSMEPLGFAVERRQFSAHVTLGRVKVPDNVEKLIELHQVTELARMRVGEITLFESAKLGSGVRYVPLSSIPLA